MWDILFNAGVGTFMEVATWIGISLIIFEFLNHLAKDHIVKLIENNKWAGPLVGALLGVTPGCGGALLMVPLYKDKKVSFGALTAAFIATFGDMAFVVMSSDIQIFGWLVLIGVIVSLVVGYTLDIPYVANRLQPILEKKFKFEEKKENNRDLKDPSRALIKVDTIILPIALVASVFFVFPATIIELINGFNDTDFAEQYIYIMSWVSFVLTMLIVTYYISMSIAKKYYIKEPSGFYKKDVTNKESTKDIMHMIFEDLIMIITWVFFGILIFDLMFVLLEDGIVWFFGLGGGVTLVLVAVMIGMIPGCGPQIAFATFLFADPTAAVWSSGAAFAALAANSINQDGDAGIALYAFDKKSAVVMRIVNSIPALIVGLIILAIGTGVSMPMP